MASGEYSISATSFEPAAGAQAAEAKKPSYGQILKSSALIGGSSLVNIGIGIVRTKAMALLLGPAGFGLAGLYGSVADLTQNIVGMGINSSGVRQIAEAVGSGDTERITRTILVLRRTSIVLGALGAFLLIVFSRHISTITFGSAKHAAAVALLSLAVLFKLISGGQGALIQGMRRIADLAKMNVASALFGTAVGIPVIYFFRERGIVPYLISVAGMAILTSWWYSRKVVLQPCSLSLPQVGEETVALLKLGFAFMISSLMTLGAAYWTRVIVLHKVGVQATGLYQCAWILGGMYVSFILQSMAADFYPRLTASINDHRAANRLVNEQAHVGLLLGGPGVIATLTLAPLVIALLYSSKFTASVPVLRWICLGMVLQVVTWPMGFIIVAKGKQNLFIFSEVAWALVSAGLTWLCVAHFGLNGAGLAYFGSYVFHGFLTYTLAKRLSNFQWSADNLRTGLLFGLATSAVFGGFYLLPRSAATVLGAVIALLTGIYSVKTLLTLVPREELPRPVRGIISLFVCRA